MCCGMSSLATPAEDLSLACVGLCCLSTPAENFSHECVVSWNEPPLDACREGGTALYSDRGPQAGVFFLLFPTIAVIEDLAKLMHAIGRVKATNS